MEKTAAIEIEQRRPKQYLMKSLVIVVTIAAVASAALGGLVRRDETWPIYVLFTCISPVALAVIVSVGVASVDWLAKRRRPPSQGESPPDPR